MRRSARTRWRALLAVAAAVVAQPPACAPAAPAARGSGGRTAVLWHGSASHWAYAHALASLWAGLNASGGFARRVAPRAREEGVAGSAAFAAALAGLRRGDVALYMGDAGGEQFAAACRAAALRCRGVRAVHYQTEPRGACLWARDGVDEQWDYSRANIRRCERARARIPGRRPL